MTVLPFADIVIPCFRFRFSHSRFLFRHQAVRPWFMHLFRHGFFVLERSFCLRPFFRDVRFCGIHAGRVVYVNDPNLGLESVPFCGHWHVFLFLLIANGFSRCQILIIDMLTLSGGTYRATGIYQGNKSGSLTTLPPPSAFPHCVTTFWVTRGCWKRYSYRVTSKPAHKPKCRWIYGSSSVIDVLPKKYVHINVLGHFLISLLLEHFFSPFFGLRRNW